MTWRAAAFERLSEGRFDLLVIGAGIVGARVAYDAGRAGLKVALVDAGDFGGATSAASSKLIHGGFRYLPRGRIGLIREAQAERGALLAKVAPNLVRPLSCLLPAYRHGSPRPALIGAGLLAYHALAGRHGAHVAIHRGSHPGWTVPGLRTEGLSLLGAFDEAQVHDSRLVLATVRAAAGTGVVVLNHARVTGLEAGAAMVAGSLPGEGATEVRFLDCVNATGPWVDRLRRLEDPACSPLVRLSKGIHVLLPLKDPWPAAVAVPVGDGRVLMAQPWFGMLLIGTTDTEYGGEPGAVQPTEPECRRLLDEISPALAIEEIGKREVLSAFAGLRALPEGACRIADAAREHLVRVGRRGVVSVAGGKLTTHRRVALEALRHCTDRRLHGLRLDDTQLPGTGQSRLRSRLVDDPTWAHLQRLYGGDAWSVAERGRERPELLGPIHPDGPDILAQWEHAVEREWAVTASDVLRNRTTAALRGGVPATEEALTARITGAPA